jgi:hypothetical protein
MLYELIASGRLVQPGPPGASPARETSPGYAERPPVRSVVEQAHVTPSAHDWPRRPCWPGSRWGTPAAQPSRTAAHRLGLHGGAVARQGSGCKMATTQPVRASPGSIFLVGLWCAGGRRFVVRATSRPQDRSAAADRLRAGDRGYLRRQVTVSVLGHVDPHRRPDVRSGARAVGGRMLWHRGGALRRRSRLGDLRSDVRRSGLVYFAA